MRAIFVIALVACMVYVAVSSPAKDLKEAKNEAAKKKACMITCNSDYTPICAGKQGKKPISFGNLCVMNNYNCEKNEVLSKISDGECPGGSGVRLS